MQGSLDNDFIRDYFIVQIDYFRMDIDYFANYGRQCHITRDIDLRWSFADDMLDFDTLFILGNRLHKYIFLPPSVWNTVEYDYTEVYEKYAQFVLEKMFLLKKYADISKRHLGKSVFTVYNKMIVLY